MGEREAGELGVGAGSDSQSGAGHLTRAVRCLRPSVSEAGALPPLPDPVAKLTEWDGDESDVGMLTGETCAAGALVIFDETPVFTAEQMHAYYRLADRAASAPQAVRMLTEQEVVDAMCTDYGPKPMSRAEALQRKFCEVNGLRIGEKAVRRPLTEEQIDALYEANCESRNPYAPSRKFFGRTVRAAEFAHGIVPLAPQDTGEK